MSRQGVPPLPRLDAGSTGVLTAALWPVCHDAVYAQPSPPH